VREHELTAIAVQTVADIERDEHWRTRQLLVDVPNGGAKVRMHNVVPRLSETPGGIKWAGGALGAHNHEVYAADLGLDREEIARLQAAGVI
jgi:formyl-CoA transferase